MAEELGKYKILDEIGRGGFAIVHRARDTELGRQVALKELRPTLLDDTEWLKRFKREARTIALLNHPRIVTIYELFETANRLFIVMRLVDGPSLEHLLTQEGRLPWSQALDIITTVAEALGYAHDEGILHRDLKPANILLDRKRGPQLSDFGLAKLASEGGSSVTAAGAIVGTPNYIAPEMWEGQGSSKQSDIYALGCILYEMLTGEKLFRGDSPPAVMMAHFNPLTLPKAWPAGVPRGVTELLTTALAKKASDRYASAGELLAAFDRLVMGEKAEAARVVEEVGREAELSRQATADIPAQLPPFILEGSALEDEEIEVDRTVLVDRDLELAQLDFFLDRALTGHGLVAFVSGEAGQGKTSLLKEFVRRAQEAQPDLIVARGICDVYTGVGDPYLPFREVLSMLCGDVETQWVAGTISRDHVLRLWNLIPHVVQALLECGPNLIDTFVSGQALTHRAETYATGQPDWLARLQVFTDRWSRDGRAGEPDQSRLFEEYTAVLGALSFRQPLLLILDDLHWADLSSVSLLGHLGRRVTDHRLLIVGAYRPEDVAQSRDGEPHPLQDILSELKRQLGDIWINLGQAVSSRSRAFIDALLDTELNRLEEAFRQELTRHTEGHPLFTIELLRDLQERGDLQRDAEGYWIEGPQIGWDSLPARVEGVIEKRIGRLDVQLQESLAIAGVEGEEFTAEVIAEVQALDARALVGRLSSELDKEHRLVTAQSIHRLGSQRLSKYRFRHSLFQKYLYNSLDEVTRAYQHEVVGDSLEALYGERAEEIALQLAWHFQEAGLAIKALHYWQKAGESAARLYAYIEAIAAYRQALVLAKQAHASDETVNMLYSRLGRILELNSQFDRALANYEEMEELAHQRGARSMELTALMAQATIAVTHNPEQDLTRGQALSERAITLARELGNQEAEAKILWNLINYYSNTNSMSQAIECGERSLVLARKLNLKEQLAFTLSELGSHCYFQLGQLEKARPLLQESMDNWRDLDNLPMLTDTLATMSLVSVYAGEFEQAIRFSDEAFDTSQSIGNLWGQSYSRFKVGIAHWEAGQVDQAKVMMEQALNLSVIAGFVPPQVITQTDLALMYAEFGAIERAREMIDLAVVAAVRQLPTYRAYPLGALAELHRLQGNVVEAAVILEQIKKDPVLEAHPVWFGPVHLTEAQLALHQQEYELVITITDKMLQFGTPLFFPYARYYQAQALLGFGHIEAARQQLLAAREGSEAIGSKRFLWSILYGLGQLEADPKEAEWLYQQSQQIVEYIADHIPEPELQCSFLALDHIREIFK